MRLDRDAKNTFPCYASTSHEQHDRKTREKETVLQSKFAPLFPSTEGYGVPTSIDFIRTETSQMVAAYSSAQCVIYDLETAAPVVVLDSAKTYSKWAVQCRPE